MKQAYKFTEWEAAEILAAALPERTQKQWWSFLKRNIENETRCDRINYHLIDGKIMYTEAALKAFVTISNTSAKTPTAETLEPITDEQLHDIVMNALDEAEANGIDLTKKQDIDALAHTEAYYYKLSGFRLDKFKYKKLLNEKIRALKELELI